MVTRRTKSRSGATGRDFKRGTGTKTLTDLITFPPQKQQLTIQLGTFDRESKTAVIALRSEVVPS